MWALWHPKLQPAPAQGCFATQVCPLFSSRLTFQGSGRGWEMEVELFNDSPVQNMRPVLEVTLKFSLKQEI